MLKEIENLKSQKNAELKDKIFGSGLCDNSKITYQNQVTYKIYNHKKSSPIEKTNQCSPTDINFKSPFGKDKRKWSKILSFFKRNINVLVNLLPEENPSQGMFNLSRQILTRPKSLSKYRPYSVSSNAISPLASSHWISNDKARPFTENKKFRPRRGSKQIHINSKPINRKTKKVTSNANFYKNDQSIRNEPSK